MLTLTVSKYIGDYTLLGEIERALREHCLCSPERCGSGCARIFHVQAFSYKAGYPHDPWSKWARGFRERMVTTAREEGIEVVFTA